MEHILDDEFKQIITAMKQYAKRLAQKSEERSKVTAWLKKLLNVKREKNERNEYAKLLLQILKSGQLEPPFSSDPPQGTLPKLNTSTNTVSSQQQPLDTYNLTGTDGKAVTTKKPQRRRSDKSKESGNYGSSETLVGNSGPPMYLIQSSNVRSNCIGSCGHSDGKIHTNEEGLWSLGTAPSSIQRPIVHASSPKPSSPLRLDRSIQLEDLLPSSPSLSLSDDVLDSDNSQLSDVSELLMGHSEHWTRSPSKALETRNPFISSFSPQKAFTSSFSAALSPRKHDITREILQSREVELKVKAAENKFEEEKLKIQRSHEESLKQILDRKNNELENLRTDCRIKESQLGAQVHRLELRLSQCLKENKQLREEGTQTVADSKQYRLKLEAQFEEKLHAVVSEFEQSKLELEQHHSKAHKRLTQEMASRIAATKEDHATQRKADAELITTLREKVQELSIWSESLTQAHSVLQQDKIKLEERCSTLEGELKAAENRLEVLEDKLVSVGEVKEAALSSLRQEKEVQLSELRAHTEKNMASIQHEYTIQESKMCEAIAELKEQVCEMEREMERVREEHSIRVTELEADSHKALRQRDLEHEKIVIELKSKLNQRDFEAEERRTRLEDEVRDRQQQLEQLRVSMEAHSKQAEKAIDDFKAEVEQQTNGMFNQMKTELAHLETELAASQSACDQLSAERNQERTRATTEREELQHRHKQALKDLVVSHCAALERQKAELEAVREEVVAKLSSDLTQLEAKMAAKESHTRKVISSLEAEVQGLREKLETAVEQHNKVLAEKEESAGEELETAIRTHKAAIGKLKIQLESEKSRMREEHRREVASLIEKHEHKEKQLEHQHSLKHSQATETLNSLKAQIQFLQESLEKQQSSHEDHLREVMRRNNEDVASLKQHHDSIRQSLTEEAEAAHLSVSQLQERTKHQQAEHSSKVSQLKHFYEEKLRGMLPIAMKQEYEDTIKSLQTQITVLQQRAGLLQDELTQRYSAHRLSPKKHVTYK